MVTATVLAAAARSGGGDDKGKDDAPARPATAGGLAAQARRDLLRAGSLRVVVTDRSTGAGRSTPSALDLSLDAEGDCDGTVTFGTRGTARVLRHADRVWLRMDDALWRARVPGAAGRALVHRIDGRYVTGPASDPTLKDLASICDLGTLRTQLRAEARDEKVTERAGPRVRDGVRVVPLTGTRGGTTDTLYVTEGDRPRLVGRTRTGDGIDITTRYADQGVPVTVQAPPAADTVSASRL